MRCFFILCKSMRALSENIFVRLLPALTLGIISATYFKISIEIVAVTMLFLCLTAASFRFISYKHRYKLQPLEGLLFLLLIGLSGYSLYQVQRPAQHLLSLVNHEDKLIIKMDEAPVPRNQVIKVTGRIEGILKHDTILPYSGKCMLFLRKSEQAASLQYNDIIICKNTLREVQRDPNPHAINYQRILNNKGIYYTGFLNDTQYRSAGHYKGFDIYEPAIKTREYCLTIFRKYIPDKEAAAVCSSLLLGQRNDLSFELENAYASAGVIHILAVSGMHVGLIYLLIRYVLRVIGLLKRQRILSFIIIISCIWFFALITGLTSSVIRASAMITLVAFGIVLKRPLFTLNILFGSAFCILCFRPDMLFDIGFQLSFSAVLGILILQPLLYQRMQTVNPVVDAIMKIMSVSIAAQAFTLPFILFYFHQIPIHFVLANLLVVPILSFIIYALIGLLVLSPIPALAYILGLSISVTVNGINQLILYIQSLPLALLHIRSFNLLMLLLCFILLLLLTHHLQSMRTKPLLASMLVATVLIGLNTYYDLQKINQQYLQVFRHDKGIVSTVRNQQQAIVLYPAGMNTRSGAFDHYLKQYFLYENVKEVLCIPVSQRSSLTVNGDWFNFNGKYLQTKDCIIESAGNRQYIQLPDKSLLCSISSGVNENVYNPLLKGPILIPLSGNEVSISAD